MRWLRLLVAALPRPKGKRYRCRLGIHVCPQGMTLYAMKNYRAYVRDEITAEEWRASRKDTEVEYACEVRP
jgi:hypothetical protein